MDIQLCSNPANSVFGQVDRQLSYSSRELVVILSAIQELKRDHINKNLLFLLKHWRKGTEEKRRAVRAGQKAVDKVTINQ